MAIQGLTGRGAQFPEIAVIRKGAPKPENGKAPGRDLSYFRFDSDEKEVADKFEEVFGKEPRAVSVFVPFATTQENFDPWREAYTAGAIQHRCDGVTCVGHRNAKGAWSLDPVPCPGGCKAVGRLKVIIPALERMAFVTVQTTSLHDILSLESSLFALELARGSLQGIPLVLRRVEREISVPDANGKRARRKKWLLQIEADPQWAALQFAGMRQAALLTATQSPLMLGAGQDEDDDDAAPSTAANESQQVYTTPAAQKETVVEIVARWSKYGKKKNGVTVPLATYIKDEYKAERWGEVSQADAEKLLGWLKSREALDAPVEAEATLADAPLSPDAVLAEAMQAAKDAHLTQTEIAQMMTDNELDGALSDADKVKLANMLQQWIAARAEVAA